MVAGVTRELTDLELAAKHRYRCPGGQIGINVTAVTGLLDWNSKSAKMAGSAAKIASTGGNYREEWRKKADLGTRVHAHCEAWLRGEEIFPLEDEVPYLDALERFFDDTAPLPTAIERVVLSGLGYGGRFDFIAEFNELNTLVDLKTGRPYAVEHTLQLSAYRYADGMATYDEAGALARLDPVPLIDRAGCLYLDREGTYSFVEYPVTERSFDIFCALLEVRQGLEALAKELP